MTSDKVYIEDFNLLFKKDSSGYFIPVKYDCEVVNNKIRGKPISNSSKEPLGKCMFDFILFIKSSGVEVDKVSGDKKEGYAEIYQYCVSYSIIKSLLLLDSSDIITAIARQAGKSFISRTLVAFSITFIPLYVDFPQARWYTTLCSFKEDTASDQLGKAEPHILDAINLFNDIYPSKPLEFDCRVTENGKNRKLKWNSNLIEINRKIGNKSIPYSSIDVIGLDKTAKNPGYTSHFQYMDEAQEIIAEHFNTTAKPFTQATGGVCYAIGTANNEPESLLRDMYDDKNIQGIKRIIFDVNKIIKFKEAVSKQHAEKYSARFKKELEKYGLHSEYIQTQYMVNFNIIGDNFTSLERLRQNNILIGDLDDEFVSQDNEYRIGAVDPALTNDMAGMVIGTSRFGENNTINKVKDVVVLHDKAEVNKSPDILVNKITQLCLVYKLDYLILDTTGNQGDRAFYLWEAFQEKKCGTMIIPYSYSSTNKKTMLGYLEDTIFNQSLILPKIEYRKTHKAYDELITQLLYLKKKRTDSGNLQYKAPQGKNFYDDLPMTLAQFNYCLEYVRRETGKRKIIDLGGGVSYFFKLRKYKEFDNVISKKSKRKSWLSF